MITQKLAEIKEDLKEVAITEKQYLEYQSIPVELQGIKEYILIKFYERDKKHIEEKQKLCEEVSSLG